MKKQLLFFCFLLSSFLLVAQNYTWMRGAAVNGIITGVYGTQGVASNSNDPGTRHGAATWVDASGNLWMFGGEGYSASTTFSWLSDLWKYNISTNQWTWMGGSNAPNQISNYGTQGIAAPSNQPGAREFSVTWTDAAGNFWLFGGDGFANNSNFGRLGDLWKYNPTTNLWTWMKGFNTIDQNGVYGTIGTAAPGNQPGARYGAATFVDLSGNLWLHGGRGFGSAGISGFLNDLWKYSPTTNQWTWMKGSNATNQLGIFGTQGTANPANMPGGKEFSTTWVTAAGIFYLAHGRGYTSVGGPGYSNDMWTYNVSTNEWTWINGANTINQMGTYGTAGVTAPSTIPGGRMSSASWKDLSGNFWLFGGLGWSTVTQNRLNDLFKYDPVTNLWTYMKGATVVDQPGVYGTMGVAAAANTPGARYFNTWWKTTNNVFWLFGSEGNDSTNNVPSNMNDLWKYTPPCNPDSILSSQGLKLCTGSQATLTAFNQYPSTVNWFNAPTGGVSVTNGSVFTTPPLTAVSSTSVYSFYAEANSCTVMPRTAVSVTVNPLPVISISGPSATCVGSSATLTASGAASYTWNAGATTQSVVLNILPTGTVGIVIAIDANGCENSATKSITALPLPTLQVSSSHSLLCTGKSATLTVTGASSYLWNTNFVSNTISVSPGTNTSYTVTGSDANGCSSAAAITQSVTVCGGFSSANLQNGLRIYPNPTSGNFKVELETLIGNEKIVIFNTLGEMVFTSGLDKNHTSFTTGIRAGVYLYTIVSGNAYYSGRLIIN